MPKRRIPDNVKSIRGTDQPCRVIGEVLDFDAIDQAPAAPDFLEIEAKKYWDRIVPVLLTKRVLSIADLEALEIMCVLYGKIRKMAAAGVDISSAMVTALRLYQTEFGLTPASRNKIAAGDKGPSGNKFGSNGRRKPT